MNVFEVLSPAAASSTIERLGWVLLHSLWQFAVTAASSWTDGSMLARIRRISLSGSNRTTSGGSPWNIVATSLAIVSLSGLLSWQSFAQTNSKLPPESKPDQAQTDEPQKEDQDNPKFSDELKVKLTRQDAHGRRWYFIDLEKGKSKTPPFTVDIDATRLPYFVNKPSEKELNDWLVREGVDLIIRSEIYRPTRDGNIEKNDIQVRSIRTLLQDLPYSLQQNADRSWSWTTTPHEVVKVFERKDDAVHVSGFVPNSFAGDIRPDSPILQPFRTAQNVVGLFLLEQPSSTEDELTLRIVHVKDSNSPMADVSFGTDDLVSGKLGANSTIAQKSPEAPFTATFPNHVRVEFVGVTQGAGDTKAAERWWKPDGTPLGFAPEYRGASGVEGDEATPYVRTVIHVHGIKDEGAVTVNSAMQSAQSNVDASGGRYVAHYGYSDAPGATRSFEVGVATEPLSLKRWLDRNGKRQGFQGKDPLLRNEVGFALVDSMNLDPIAEDITIEKVGPETWGRKVAGFGPMIDPVGPGDEPGGRNAGTTQVTIRVPLKWRQVDLRLFAVDKAGKSHSVDMTVQLEPNEANANYTRLAKILPISFDEVDHFEYQFRLYRHWVTFENVSQRKGEITKVNVVPKTIPAVDVKHGSASKKSNRVVDQQGKPIPGAKVDYLPSMILLPDFVNVMAVRFDADSRTLTSVATKGDVTIRTWDIAEKKLVREIKLDTKVDSDAAPIFEIQFLNGGLGLSRDAKQLVACTKGKVRVWNTEDGKLIQTLPSPIRDGRSVEPRGLASTPNFDIIAAAIGNGFSISNECEIAVWQGEKYGRIKRLSHSAAEQITSLALSTDGSRLASGSQSASICVFDLATGKLLYTLPNSNADLKHPDPKVTEAGANQVLCIAFSPDGKKLAIGDLLGVKIVDAATGELIHAVESPFRFGRSGLIFSSDSKLLARTATDKTVPIWSVETGKLILELPTEAHDAAFSNDGKWFATGFTDDKQGLALWNLAELGAN